MQQYFVLATCLNPVSPAWLWAPCKSSLVNLTDFPSQNKMLLLNTACVSTQGEKTPKLSPWFVSTCVPFRFLCSLLHEMCQCLKCSQNSRFSALMAVKQTFNQVSETRQLPGVLCSSTAENILSLLQRTK